jgi:hypothetical protein
VEIGDAASFAMLDCCNANQLVYSPNRIAASFLIRFSSNSHVIESILMAAISHEYVAALIVT